MTAHATPQQTDRQRQQQWQKVGAQPSAPQDGLAEGDRHQPGGHAAKDKASPARNATRGTFIGKDHSAEPEGGQDSKRASDGGRQARRHDGWAEPGCERSHGIDNHGLTATVGLEKERMIAGQHAQCVHAIVAFVKVEEGRHLVKSPKTQEAGKCEQQQHHAGHDHRSLPVLGSAFSCGIGHHAAGLGLTNNAVIDMGNMIATDSALRNYVSIHPCVSVGPQTLSNSAVSFSKLPANTISITMVGRGAALATTAASGWSKIPRLDWHRQVAPSLINKQEKTGDN